MANSEAQGAAGTGAKVMDIGKTLSDGLGGVLSGVAGGPVGMVAGLLSHVAPDLFSTFLPHLAGSQGGEVASAVMSAVSAATGQTEPTAADVQKLSPDDRAALQVQLAGIAVSAEKARLDAAVVDTQSARSMTVELKKSGSVIAYGAPVISGIVLVSFAVVAWLVMFRPIPVGSETLAAGVLETLKLLSVTIVSFWCGSSAGSRAKDATLASAQDALASSMPVPAQMGTPGS